MLKKTKSEQALRMPNIRKKYFRQESTSAQERATARRERTIQYPICVPKGMGDMALTSNVPYFTKSSLKKRMTDPAAHKTIRIVAEKSNDDKASLFSIEDFLRKFVKFASDLFCPAIHPDRINCTS